MLHIEAAAIAEKQNFDCRVSSNYERERERERERDVSGSQNSIWVKEQSQHSAEHEVSLSFTHKQTCPHKKSLEKMQ
jgi:hypothetical protein